MKREKRLLTGGYISLVAGFMSMVVPSLDAAVYPMLLVAIAHFVAAQIVGAIEDRTREGE